MKIKVKTRNRPETKYKDLPHGSLFKTTYGFDTVYMKVARNFEALDEPENDAGKFWADIDLDDFSVGESCPLDEEVILISNSPTVKIRA